jgi:hypothetical protein
MSGAGALAVISRLAKDRGDQISLAQTPKAVETKLIGNRMQVGQR